jgi:plasmid stability protein
MTGEILMAVHPVTLELPSTLYSRVKERAVRTQRSVEDELLDVLAGAIPASEELPPDLAEALAPLALLDDAALWRAARSHLPATAAARLEALHLKRQSEGLSDTESGDVARLVRQYERVMLVRARAAALLEQRGHDVSSLLAGG